MIMQMNALILRLYKDIKEVIIDELTSLATFDKRL
jgi:hypothetical protein